MPELPRPVRATKGRLLWGPGDATRSSGPVADPQVTERWKGSQGRRIAEAVAHRLLTAIHLIQVRDLTHARRELEGWYVGLDLTQVPREVIERTSDRVRCAKVHLNIPPTEPEVAISALREAVALWRPVGGVFRPE